MQLPEVRRLLYVRSEDLTCVSINLQKKQEKCKNDLHSRMSV
jgi:hypothetical protein